MESYDKVKNWLITSGLCILDKSDPNVGALHSFYDVKKREFGFLYPEITGYYISTMKFLYSQEKSGKYLETAKLSGTWLKNIIDKYGGIIMGVNSDKRKSELIFSFDSSICAKGFLDLYEITGDKKYLQYAKDLLDWLSTKCVNQDGTVKPVMERESQNFTETSMWYAQKGCFGIKLAMPFLQYPDDSQNFKDLAKKICDTFKDFQNKDGSFAVHLGSSSVNLHSHCYAMEGLLYAYYILKDYNYLESCKKGLEWAISRIKEDGSIYLWTNFNYSSKACYPTAQLIRLLILVDSIEKNTKYNVAISRLTKFLLSLQAVANDSRIDGGFYEEFYKSFFTWKRRDKINSWGSMFALQALKWIEIRDSLSFAESIKLLF